MAIQDDARTLLRVIAEATEGSSVPVILEDVPDLQMDVERAKAAFNYLKGKRLIETFNLAYSARVSAAGHDFLAAQPPTSPPTPPAPAPPPPPQVATAAPAPSAQGSVLILQPNFYGIGIDLRELWRRIFRRSPSGPRGALILLPDESQSFAHHAPQQDGRKLTQIAVRGWATNTTDTPLYPTLVRISRPFGLKATSHFIMTQGGGGTFGRDHPVQPQQRREITAHFFVEGFVGKPGRPLRVVIKVCDNLGRWHPWVFPTLPNGPYV
jgi:hypothetical protein